MGTSSSVALNRQELHSDPARFTPDQEARLLATGDISVTPVQCEKTSGGAALREGQTSNRIDSAPRHLALCKSLNMCKRPGRYTAHDYHTTMLSIKCQARPGRSPDARDPTCCLVHLLHNVYLGANQHHISPICSVHQVSFGRTYIYL
jgi:hypothetical protein